TWRQKGNQMNAPRINTSSTEAQAVWRKLAEAIADTLACDETPTDLASALLELENDLVDLLVDHKYASSIILLRALAMAESGHRTERFEAKTAPTSQMSAKASV